MNGGGGVKTIETTARVEPDGTLTGRVPPDVLPGEYHLLVVIEGGPTGEQQDSLDDFPVDDWGPWPAGLSLRREDL